MHSRRGGLVRLWPTSWCILNSALYMWGVRDDAGQLRAVARLAMVRRGLRRAGGRIRRRRLPRVGLGGHGHRRPMNAAVARVGGTSRSHSPAFTLIVIIALGDRSSRRIATAELDRDATYALSVLVAFASVAALWWAAPTTAVARTGRSTAHCARGPLARDVFTYLPTPWCRIFTQSRRRRRRASARPAVEPGAERSAPGSPSSCVGSH